MPEHHAAALGLVRFQPSFSATGYGSPMREFRRSATANRHRDAELAKSSKGFSARFPLTGLTIRKLGVGSRRGACHDKKAASASAQASGVRKAAMPACASSASERSACGVKKTTSGFAAVVLHG